MCYLYELTKGGDLGAISAMVTSNPDLMKAAGSLFDDSDSSVGGNTGLIDKLSSIGETPSGDALSGLFKGLR